MRFRVINLVNGNIVECMFHELSQKLSLNCEILRYKSDGGLEAIGFVSYDVMLRLVNKFAASIYDKYSTNKDARIVATIHAVNDYLNNRISKQHLKDLIDQANLGYFDATFENANVVDNIIANNVFLAATSCVLPNSAIISDIPSYCLSASDLNKHNEQIAQSSYVLEYFGVH